MNLYEQRFEATTREGLELVCVVLLQGATRCFHFVKNEASKLEVEKITHQSAVNLYPELIRICKKISPDPESGNDL